MQLNYYRQKPKANEINPRGVIYIPTKKKNSSENPSRQFCHTRHSKCCFKNTNDSIKKRYDANNTIKKRNENNRLINIYIAQKHRK